MSSFKLKNGMAVEIEYVWGTEDDIQFSLLDANDHAAIQDEEVYQEVEQHHFDMVEAAWIEMEIDRADYMYDGDYY